MHVGKVWGDTIELHWSMGRFGAVLTNIQLHSRTLIGHIFFCSLLLQYLYLFMKKNSEYKQMQIKWISHLLVCHFLELELLEGQAKALHLQLWQKKKHFFAQNYLLKFTLLQTLYYCNKQPF